VSDCDRLDFQFLQCKLLREHNITDPQIPSGREAQEANPPLGVIKQLDVQNLPMPDFDNSAVTGGGAR
jgi:hypothetical protein